MRRISLVVLMGVCAPVPLAGSVGGPDDPRAMLGVTPSRNMVSPAVRLPARWDPATGEAILWTAALGSETYGGPVEAAGRVFVGTNNANPRNPAVQGDRGVVMAFSARDGSFLWQATHEKVTEPRGVDWPLQGVCSTPAVEGDRLYYVSNRGELVAADTEGFLDGENDGPFTAEADRGPAAADIVWALDMRRELGVVPHNMPASSPLVVGDLVFAGTGNGVGENGKVPAPPAPSLVAVRRATGEVAWSDASPGDRILDGQWSSPSYGVIRGRPQLLFPGGDGWLYAFAPETGSLLWKFDAGGPPPAPQEAPHGATQPRESLIAPAVIHGDLAYLGIGQDPELGPGKGRLWAIGPPAEPGSTTASPAVAGSTAALRAQAGSTTPSPVWHVGGDAFSRTLSAVAVHDGLVYAADLRGFLYALEAGTGTALWSHDLFANVWGSPLVADGKVYLGDEDGDLVVLRAGRKLEILHEVNMGSAIYTTPFARDGVLYVATRTKLFAIGAGRRPADPKPQAAPRPTTPPPDSPAAPHPAVPGI